MGIKLTLRRSRVWKKPSMPVSSAKEAVEGRQEEAMAGVSEQRSVEVKDGLQPSLARLK